MSDSEDSDEQFFDAVAPPSSSSSSSSSSLSSSPSSVSPSSSFLEDSSLNEGVSPRRCPFPSAKECHEEGPSPYCEEQQEEVQENHTSNGNDNSTVDQEEKDDSSVANMTSNVSELSASTSIKSSSPKKLGFASSIMSLFGGINHEDNGSEDEKKEEHSMSTTSDNDSEVDDYEDDDDDDDFKEAYHGGKHDDSASKGSHDAHSTSSKSWARKIWNIFHRRRVDYSEPSHRSSHNSSVEKKTGVKASLIGKKKHTFESMSVMQVVDIHHGPVWAMQFSHDGRFLATGGQDGKAVVWSVGCDRRESCLIDVVDEDIEQLPPPSFSMNPTSSSSARYEVQHELNEGSFLFDVPCRVFGEHDGHIVDLSWSKSNFLLTACLDKMVRLWHIKSPSCLQKFKHPDLVSSIHFHPADDRYFVSGCFDKMVRVWDITNSSDPVQFKEAQDMVTAVAFTPDGSRIAVGLFRGQIFFYKTEDLKIETQIVCTKSVSKRKAKYGFKVTGLVFRTMKESANDEEDAFELLVTTNDSNIRLYRVKDLSLTTKFKGLTNKSKPIRASFSNSGHHIICGSDTVGVYLWKVPKRRQLELFHADRARFSRRERAKSKDGDSESVASKDDRLRARLERLYYSKKYEVYSKCERFICEANFKSLTTTVALFAPPLAIKEASDFLVDDAAVESNDGGEQAVPSSRAPYDTVILNAEINGSIRIIKAKHIPNH